MKFISVDDESIITDLLCMLIEGEISEAIGLKASSGNEAIKVLKENPDILFIISDFNMPNGNGDILYQYAQENHPKVPFFFLTSILQEEFKDMKVFHDFDTREGNRFFQKPYDDNEILKAIRQVTKTDSQEDSQIKKQDFSKVKVDFFLNFNTVNTDIYIKLADNKFIKLIHAEEMYDHERIKKYISRDCHYFYVKKESFNFFLGHFNQAIISLFERNKSKNNNITETFDLEQKTIEHIILTAKEFGIEGETIELIDKVNKSIINNLSEGTRISSIIKNIIKNDQYLYQHSLLLSYFTNAMAIKLGCTTDTTLSNLSTACFLHDIDFEDENLAKMHDLIDINSEEIDQATKRRIQKHPQEASSIISSVEDLHPDIAKIVLYHHERPDGSGFPRGLNANEVPSIACIFILAEQLIDFIWQKEVDLEKINEFKNSLKIKFDCGNYKKPLEALLALN